MSHKAVAAEAIDAALTNAHKLEPSRDQRYLIADLETARDALTLVEEKIDKRRHRKKKEAVKP